MHRSGTSCLIGSLQQAGLQLGKFHGWNRFNQKGSRENQDIVDFHDALLAANRSSWDRPPARLRYSEQDLDRARELLEKYGSVGLWGFKDPRTLLALRLWQEVAPGLRCIGVFRHPRAVAESLRRRSAGRMSPEHALDLWHHYNSLLYDAWKREHFPVLSFDWSEAVFRERVDAVAAGLGLPGCGGQQPFYSSDLLHFQGVSRDGIPRRSERLYEALQEASEA